MQTILISRDEQSMEQKPEMYIGARSLFPDPFHLYLHLEDVESQSPIVRFVCYSMGKKKIVMVGNFRRRNRTFDIVYGCRYSLSDLTRYLEEWRPKFANTLNITKNRIQSRIQAFSGIPADSLLANQDDYMLLLEFLEDPTSKNPKIVEYQQRIANEVPAYRRYLEVEERIVEADLVGDDIYVYELLGDREELWEHLESILGARIQEYERKMNLLQYQQTNTEVVSISKEFYEWISRSKYSSEQWAKTLDRCSCKISSDPGCQIIEWGEDIDLL